jgi:serine/threonine protein kinase
MGCSNSQSSTPVCTSEEIAAQDFHDIYLLGIKLGRGAFAQVRICTKIGAGPLRPESQGADGQPKERAVKILDLRDKDKPEEVSGQLQKAAHKEACVWKTVGNHPNCIRLYDVFASNDFCYMVMEKCSSGLLQALESMPEVTERGLGNVFAQMLLGIAHCHSVKVVHRDIKPDNFLVGGQDGQTIKLADFGLSASLPKQGKLPGVFGTAPFMCPEMLVGRWYDEKADVWSFAVIVYVLLFGLFPYMPKQQSSKAMKQAIIEGGSTPPAYEPVQKGLAGAALYRSSDAISMVKTLLSREPEERPSAEEALHTSWMSAALEGTHLPGKDLPSLRPMLHHAKKVGAFEVRDPARDSNVDVVLNQIQLQRHGKALPVTPSGGIMGPSSDRRPQIVDQRGTSKNSKLPKPSGSGKDWENASNRSTACGDGSSSVNDSHSDRGVGRVNDGSRGSGWSKDTSNFGPQTSVTSSTM